MVFYVFLWFPCFSLRDSFLHVTVDAGWPEIFQGGTRYEAVVAAKTSLSKKEDASHVVGRCRQVIDPLRYTCMRGFPKLDP